MTVTAAGWGGNSGLNVSVSGRTPRQEEKKRRGGGKKSKRKESNQAPGHPGHPGSRRKGRILGTAEKPTAASVNCGSDARKLKPYTSASNWLWLMYPSVPSDAAPEKGRARLRGWNHTPMLFPLFPNGDNCQRIRPTYAGRSRQHNPISECCRPGCNKVEKKTTHHSLSDF